MAAIKNIQFTRLIKVQSRLKEFNFRKRSGIAGGIYEIDVTDDHGNRHYISMQLTDTVWTIREKEIPAWILEVLPKLQTAIEEQEQ
jgi:hypothetical protein